MKQLAFLAICGFGACLTAELWSEKQSLSGSTGTECLPYSVLRTPFRLVQDYLIIVRVRANGLGPYDFVLDTGANSTIIDRDLARRFELLALDRVSLVTPAGTRAVPRGRLRSLTLGPHTARDVEVLWMDLTALRAADPAIRGVVGHIFLSQFNFMLSYRDRQIKYDDSYVPETTSRVVSIPFRWEEGRAIIRATQNQAAHSYLELVLDSGIPELVIFKSSLHPMNLQRGVRGDLLNLSTSVGSRAALSFRFPELWLGSVRLVDLAAIVVPEPRPESGLMPTRFFHSIYFDHARRLVVLSSVRSR